jgi:hypothetical protein
MKQVVLTTMVVLSCRLCLAQGAMPAVAQAAPGQHLESGAGMPLMDGSLPPGTLTVRIVRGAFVEDLTGQDVAVDVLGGDTREARTGQGGRAQLEHLPVGAHVRASAVVAGERLESEVFQMPPDTGVRVLLVAGRPASPEAAALPDAADPETAFLAAAAPVLMSSSRPVPADAVMSDVEDRSGSRRTSGVLMAGLLAGAAAVFGVVVFRRK